MKRKSMGRVIALREIDLEGGDKIRVEIGTPKEFPEGGGYYCPYRIKGIGEGKLRYAGGVDSVQALELMLKCIATDLYTSEEFKSDRLRHMGMKNLGFPVFDAIADLVPKDDER